MAAKEIIFSSNARSEIAKGLNLLAQDGHGTQDPFLKGFAAGIKDFQMRNGELRVILND